MKEYVAILLIAVVIFLLVLVRETYPTFPVLGIGVGIGYIIGKNTKKD